MMARKYWLNLFTGKTWETFLKTGANVTGFRIRRRNFAKKIKPGDYFICYVTGISRFIAVLEVKSECYIDEKTSIWEDEMYPVRFKVKMIHKLDPKTAIPVMDLQNVLSIFNNLKSPNAWTGFFRGSPAEFKEKDGEVVLKAIENAMKSPTIKEYDDKKYWRIPKKYESKIGFVTVPETNDALEPDEYQGISIEEKTTHEEIQWKLLKLGSELGLDVWVARNDRNKEYAGNRFSEIPRLRNTLPRQFDPATNKTIELIDVLWLNGDAIIAAFEVEHTTAIYSGLLRMGDLISMQPNIKLNLYLVAPDERREKVIMEINRPTFARLKPPLPKICKLISYSDLKKLIDDIGPKMKYIKPEIIDEIAESCETDES